MRDLKLNPLMHEVEISADVQKENGYANVHLDIGGEIKPYDFSITQSHAKQIGEWFIKLSKELSK